MTIPRVSILVALAWTVASAAPAHGQSSAPDSVLYSLVSPPSDFEYGCFGPCACPVLIQAPLTGSFVLKGSRIDPLYTWYDVLDVRWKVQGQTQPIHITGSGYYRRGGEVALMEELALDLSFDGGAVQRFSSGLRSPGAAFPEIRTQISLHSQFCFDSVLTVNAKPMGGPVGVGDDEIAFAVHPNPFGASAEVRFALSRGGEVSLGVFDLGGRRVRELIGRQWLPNGPQARVWDGRLDEGGEAAAGLYFIRLEMPSGTVTRTIVKLR